MAVPTTQKIRFGAFELDRHTGELYQNGNKLKLQGQPIAVLSLLLDRSGELVTREELRKHLWPEDTFVDFEHSLNTHIKKLRQVFDDDAETPRYIETLPRRGYRFIAQVEAIPSGSEAAADQAKASPTAVDGPDQLKSALPSEALPPPKLARWKYAISVALLLAAAGAAPYWFIRPRTPVVTAVHQLTRTGHPRGLWGDTANSNVYLETDGTRVYFQELADGKWQLAEVSTKGGEVSYLHTPLINTPTLAGISQDGSALLVADVSHWAIDSPFWVLPLPDGPARRVPGAASWMWYLPGTDQIVYQHFPDLRPLFAAKLDGSETRPLMTLPADLGEYLALSPDGKRVRFATADGKSWESRLDGNGMHRFLPEFTAPTCCGYWSGNGKLYVFASPDGDVWKLWALTEPAWPLPGFKSRPTRLTSGPISFRASTFSSDGKQIFALGDTPRGELSVFDPKSGLFGRYGSGLSAGFTDFSRDGQWMAYVSHPEGPCGAAASTGANGCSSHFLPWVRFSIPDGRPTVVSLRLWN